MNKVSVSVFRNSRNGSGRLFNIASLEGRSHEVIISLRTTILRVNISSLGWIRRIVESQQGIAQQFSENIRKKFETETGMARSCRDMPCLDLVLRIFPFCAKNFQCC